VRTMTTYVRRNKVPLEVLDITQLIQRALGPKAVGSRETGGA
jgi:heterodisulfide reductase subunit D